MKIKEKPEDFYVKEIIDLNKKEPGETFKYFILWKRNLTTIRAIKIVSKKLGISKRRISFAGEKDKRAITEQYISIRGLKRFEEKYDFGNVKLKYVGSFSEPIKISDIVGNYFKIRIKIDGEKEKKRFLENVNIYSNYFINYFDDQRFGDIRSNNHLIGREILKRNWEEACKILLTYISDKENPLATEARKFLKENWGKWREAIKKFPKWLDVELAILNYLVKNPNDFFGALKKIHRRLLKLFIHSYQSYLWNKIVSQYLKSNYKKLGSIDIIGEKFNILADINDFKKIKDKKAPIVGYNTKLEDYIEFRDIIMECLNKDGIKLDMFFFPELPSLSSEGSERKIVETPKNFEYELKENEIVVSFILNRGSYATMLIKHLFS